MPHFGEHLCTCCTIGHRDRIAGSNTLHFTTLDVEVFATATIADLKSRNDSQFYYAEYLAFMYGDRLSLYYFIFSYIFLNLYSSSFVFDKKFRCTADAYINCTYNVYDA